MKIINNIKKENDDINTYTFDNISNLKEIFNLIIYLSNNYGNISNIEIKLFNNILKYNNLDELMVDNNLVFNNILTCTFYSSSKNIKFNLDIRNKTLSVSKLNNELNKFTYYKLSNGTIVRYDKEKYSFYYLDEDNNWKYDNTLIEQIYENNDYEEITSDDVKTMG